MSDPLLDEGEPPRPAATVVVLRDASTGPEVLLLRRKSALAFYGGAWVFPGGAIDAQDHGGGSEADVARAARNAAARELQEEAGLSIAAAELECFSRWITPPGRTRRFDAWFFAAQAPDGAIALDAGEVDAYRWLTPRSALEARARREIELPPPTFVTLTILASQRSAALALESLRTRGFQFYAPRPHVLDGENTVYLYEGDAGYDTRDPLAQGARHRLIIQGDAWSYEDSALVTRALKP